MSENLAQRIKIQYHALYITAVTQIKYTTFLLLEITYMNTLDFPTINGVTLLLASVVLINDLTFNKLAFFLNKLEPISVEN